MVRTWKTNLLRRPEYRIEKRVEQRGVKKVFVKSAATEASKPFLARIYEREQIAAHYFDRKAKVITGSWDKETLIYPYIESPTLEENISTAIKQREEGFGVALVTKYADFLRALPTTMCVPTAYYDFIRWQATDTQPVECLTFAPYDCIPRNIVMNGGKWRLLDLEWTFKFPLPQEFLFWRGLMSLLGGLQQSIQAHVSEREPAILFRGYGHTRVYMPHAWYIAFGLGKMDLRKYQMWEGQFARQIAARQIALSEIEIKERPTRLAKQPKLVRRIPKRESAQITAEEFIKNAFSWARIRLKRIASPQAMNSNRCEKDDLLNS